MSSQKILTISLIGAPNAGKSTLINLIIGEKVSSMSPKPHTTRVPVKGVYTKNDTQLVFLDTPGFTHAQAPLEIDSDCICLILDATHPWQYNNKTRIEQLLNMQNIIFYIVINKGDLIPKDQWVALIQELQSMGYKDIIWFTSALYNKGVDKLLESLIKQAEPGEWWFESDKKHELTKKEIVIECIREKIFHLTHKEVPYSITFDVDEISFRKNKPWLAKVYLNTERDGQKNILVGKNGNNIKSIGQAARMELCSRFGPGSLFLNVRSKNIG